MEAHCIGRYPWSLTCLLWVDKVKEHDIIRWGRVPTELIWKPKKCIVRNLLAQQRKLVRDHDLWYDGDHDSTYCTFVFFFLCIFLALLIGLLHMMWVFADQKCLVNSTRALFSLSFQYVRVLKQRRAPMCGRALWDGHSHSAIFPTFDFSCNSLISYTTFVTLGELPSKLLLTRSANTWPLVQ